MIAIRRGALLALLCAAAISRGEDAKKDETKSADANAKAAALFNGWMEKAKAANCVKATFDLTVFHTDGSVESSSVTRASLQAIRPDRVRADILSAEGKPTYMMYWGDGSFHYFLSDTKTMLVFLRPKAVDRPEGLPVAYRARWSEIMTSAPKRFGFLFLGMDPKECASRFKVRFLEEDDRLAWVALDPLDDDDKELYQNLALGFDAKTKQLTRVAMIVSERREYLLSLTSVQFNPDPPVTKESIAEGLPKDWQRVPFDPEAPGP